MKEFKKLTPFKLQVLENFPFIDEDFDAITNYELLCKVVEYLNKTIGEVSELNNKVNEFQNYFDNLDVQEEINNKLDEMAESGELTDIIAQYLELAGVLAFNTLNDLKDATNIASGSTTRILGKVTYNDGFGAYYKIRPLVNTDVIDNDNLVALTNYPLLVGEKIKNEFEEKINPLTKSQELYLASFFDNDANRNNFLYASSNGKVFSKLNELPWNNVRDVDIIYYNNMFYALTTETSDDLSIADLYISKDLENWERKNLYLELGQTNPNYRNYAVKWFIDGDNIYITGAYQVGTTIDSISGIEQRDFRLYIVKVLNMDFNNFELDTPTKLTQFNYNLIDPFIIKKDNLYYLFAKKETNEGVYLSGQIQTFTSSDLINWNLISTTISSLENYKYEGMSVVYNNNEYIMYLDNYDGGNGSYMQFITSTDLINWTKPNVLECEGYTTRHGSIRKIENGIAEKIILSYKNKYDTNYMTKLRKCIILPRVNSNNINKYVKIATIKCNENYRSLNMKFNLKDIENDSIDSIYYLSIYKQNNEPTINLKEEFNKFTDVNKIFIRIINNTTYELYYATLTMEACTPCIIIKDIMCTSFDIELNNELKIIDNIPDGTSIYPSNIPSYNKVNTSDLFRIEKIMTFSGETSITATFTNKRNYQSFSCIIFARENCLLFQAQVNGNGEFVGTKALDMTGQGKTYSITTGTNTVTLNNLDEYDEYTLLITDSTIDTITFSK